MSAALHGHPLFAGLSTAGLELLDPHARESRVDAGHPIVQEGERGRHLFLIDRGSVRIWKAGRDGECELARLDEGKFFGEMGILDREGRCASVQAITETDLVILPYVAFEILANAMPLDYAHLLENLARELVQRLRALDDRFSTIT